MGRAKTQPVAIFVGCQFNNCQFNNESPNPVQDNRQHMTDVKDKERPRLLKVLLGKLGSSFRALAEFLGNSDPNIIVALCLMIFGNWL